MKTASRINIDYPSTLLADRNIHICEPIDEAAWIWHSDCEIEDKAFLCFRKSFSSDGSTLRVHVTADMRYRLYCDGQQVAIGPDRSDVNHWTYSTYDIELDAGEHELTADVWWLGDVAPQALITHRGAFCLKADQDYHDALTTGVAQWEVAKRAGWQLERKPPPHCYHDIGYRQHINQAEWTAALDWSTASTVRPAVIDNTTGVNRVAGWRCFPSPLPAQINRRLQVGSIRAVIDHPQATGVAQKVSSEHCQDQRIQDWDSAYQKHENINIPANSDLAILIDLEDYYCAYPTLSFVNGSDAHIDWEWAESLYQNDVLSPEPGFDGAGLKGNRNEIENKYWHGFGHSCTSNGQQQTWQPYWWSSGRYVMLRIKTADEALALQRVEIEETRYPLEQELVFSSSNPLHEDIQSICLRVMQSCSHESYMDCPYYEQMQYVGDTRLELLTHYVLQADRRLPKRAIELFDFSRSAFGFVAERCTSRWEQQSNSFAAIWVLCLHDFAQWNPGEDVYIKERMIGMRSNLDQFLPYRESDGLIHNEPGWTFIDWVVQAGWDTGYAPGYHNGRCCAIFNGLYLQALQAAAALEREYGNQHLSTYYQELAEETAAGLLKAFWNEERGLLADDLAQEYYSQHANCLAIIAGILSDEQQQRAIQSVKDDHSFAQCTIYFKYYLFEAFYRCNEAEALHNEYNFWGDLLKQGLKTCVEAPEPTRSDCHAWGAHPIYHLVASVAGLRPDSSGKTFSLKPCLHDVSSLKMTVPHPLGNIDIQINEAGVQIDAPESIELIQ